MPLNTDPSILRPGLPIQYWLDDATPAFAMVAKIRDNPSNDFRPPLTLAFLNPISGAWINKVEVDPVIDDGLRLYRARRWCFIEDNVQPALI